MVSRKLRTALIECQVRLGPYEAILMPDMIDRRVLRRRPFAVLYDYGFTLSSTFENSDKDNVHYKDLLQTPTSRLTNAQIIS